MKKVLALPAIGLLALFCSCQKQQTEAERNAEIELQVNQRLAAEHQAEEQQQQLAQRQAELDAREKALANRESARSEHTSASSFGLARHTRSSPNAADRLLFHVLRQA